MLHSILRQRTVIAPTVLCIVLVGLWPLATLVRGQPGERHYSASTEDWMGSAAAGEPVSAANGAYYFHMPFLSLGGPMDLRCALSYRSDFSQASAWGGVIGLPTTFWWQPLENIEYSRDPFYTFVTAQVRNGDFISFKWEADQWVPTEMNDFEYENNTYPTRWLLQETNDWFYLMDPIGEQVHMFRKLDETFARIVRIVDRNGNQLVYSYDTPYDMNPVRVEDGLGRFFELTYRTVGIETVLASVTDQGGRQITFAHEPAGADNDDLWTLRSVTGPAGATTSFDYTTVPRDDWFGWVWSDLITKMKKPLGNSPVTQVYESKVLNGNSAPRVVSQQDAYGNTMTLSYHPGAYEVTESRPDAATVVYEHYGHHGLPKSVTDPTGRALRFGRDEVNNRLTSMTNRRGDTARVAYDERTGKITSYTDVEGNTTTCTYEAQDQTFTNPENGERVTFTFYALIKITYADGSYEEFTYDAQGNLTACTDRARKAWQYEHNARGQVTKVTNPTGGVVGYTYHADGTRASRTDAQGGVTAYGYDAYKRLNKITRPDGSTVRFTYDLNDRLLAFTDGLGRTSTFAYDANGNLVTGRNPQSQTVTYAHDLMDRVSERTDPLGQTRRYTYDEMGRLETTTDRNGHTTTYGYDPRGWRDEVTDPLGHTWATPYDDEGVPRSFTTPLGHATTFQTDKFGRATVTTDPLGAHADFSYDGVGRLIAATDRVGRVTDYAYNDIGRLVSVTKPATGTATYTRNDLEQLTGIADPRGKVWTFGYSDRGRLISASDPLGRPLTYGYDERGRIARTTYADATAATIGYDNASQVTRVTYPGGPIVEYTYDDAGRRLTANDLTLTYDDRGDVTDSRDTDGASFGATYDAGRRLQTVTYDGQATVTYTYDARNLLIRVEDDLSGAWMEFTHDDDRRLTEIRRSNGVSTTFIHDDAGRVTRIQDGAIADQQYTLNAEGQPVAWEHVMTDAVISGRVAYTYGAAGRLTEVDYGNEDRLTYTYDNSGNLLSRTGKTPTDAGAAAENYTYDDAAQISTVGYAYDARARQTAAPGRIFTWDGASRLASVTADGTSTTFTYNGLDDLRTRNVGGRTTTYYHNYALGLAPIMAEKEETELLGDAPLSGSAYRRFYVCAPSGQLLYSIDPSLKKARFYHYDRLGSTLFLTDSAGTVSDIYAYDPYGRLLGHAGDSDQPFTYVGRYGVRFEPVGELYHMRARYYDAGTTRFISRDPLWPLFFDNHSLNPYEYAGRSPLSRVDPRGLSPLGPWEILGNMGKAFAQYLEQNPDSPLLDNLTHEQRFQMLMYQMDVVLASLDTGEEPYAWLDEFERSMEDFTSEFRDPFYRELDRAWRDILKGAGLPLPGPPPENEQANDPVQDPPGGRFDDPFFNELDRAWRDILKGAGLPPPGPPGNERANDPLQDPLLPRFDDPFFDELDRAWREILRASEFE